MISAGSKSVIIATLSKADSHRQLKSLKARRYSTYNQCQLQCSGCQTPAFSAKAAGHFMTPDGLKPPSLAALIHLIVQAPIAEEPAARLY